jgi:S-adenosylmethionine:tRNA ribosyltransferase-isomerase
MELRFADDAGVRVHVLERQSDEYLIRVDPPEPALDLLGRLGRMPLPPYIKRSRDHDARDSIDAQRYQTVYACAPGSVAAPTAGLHFTPPLLCQLDAAGIERVTITLHVGLGTFKPVTAHTLEGHTMHEEVYQISPVAAEQLNRATAQGRRIIAVGTTSARVLESQPAGQPFAARNDRTGIFIYPPYRWQYVRGLITNFHLPRSTLIALVAAMTGLTRQRQIYDIAIRQRYRFFSYGDAMLIE